MTDLTTDTPTQNEELKKLMIQMLQNQHRLEQQVSEISQKLEDSEGEKKELQDKLENIEAEVKKTQQKVESTKQVVVRTNYVHAGLLAALVLGVGWGVWSGAFQRAAIRFGTPIAQGIGLNVATNMGNGIIDTIKSWWPF